MYVYMYTCSVLSEHVAKYGGLSRGSVLFGEAASRPRNANYVTPSLPYWSQKHATRTLVQLPLSPPLPIPCHCVGTQAVLAGAGLSPLPLTTPY